MSDSGSPSTPPPQTHRSRRPAVIGFAIAAGAGLVYLLIAGNFRFDFQQTSFTHHVWIADAFLHGQLHARDELVRGRIARERPIASEVLDVRLRDAGATLSPEQRTAWIEEHARVRVFHDWTVVDGRLYGYWGPLAAVVAMPAVLLFGPDASDTLISAIVGAANVGLFYWMLRRIRARGLLTLDDSCVVALTVLFAFGTVHFFLACAGRAWFTSQLVTLTALLGATIAALSARLTVGSALLAGACFGAALLGRNFVALTAAFFIGLFWCRLAAENRGALWALLARTIAFAVPCAAAIGVQGWYNVARFGDPLESGQERLVMTTGESRFRDDYQKYGQFHPHFLARNIHHYLLNARLIPQRDGKLAPDPDGNSMFLVTPPLLYALLAWRQRRPILLALLAGTLPVFVALLLFRATGYQQFGNRYLLEVMPFLLLLVGAGMRGRLTNVSYALIVLAVAAHLYGTYWMCRPAFDIVEQWADWRPIAALLLLSAVGRVAFVASRRSESPSE